MLRNDLVQRLENFAEKQNRSVNELLEEWLDEHENTPTPQPAPEDMEARYEAARRKLLPRFIEMARKYWREVGDEERLALTDEELYEQFWFIDHNGIPRLKSDEVELLPHSSITIAETAKQMPRFSNQETNVAEHSREILKKEYGDYILSRMNRPADAENTD